MIFQDGKIFRYTIYEKENLWPILFSKFKNSEETIDSPVSTATDGYLYEEDTGQEKEEEQQIINQGAGHWKIKF